MDKPEDATRRVPLRKHLADRALTQGEAIGKMIATQFDPNTPNKPEGLLTTNLALPDIKSLPQNFKDYLHWELIDGVIEATLERRQVINWDVRLPRLTPVLTRAQGNCLLDGACLAMWGIQDMQMSVRKQVQIMLDKSQYSAGIQSRYKGNRDEIPKLIRQATGSLPSGEEKGEKKGVEFLEQLHILALAHVLQRPIIVYGDPHDRNEDDVIFSTLEGEQRMDGIYLPLELTASYFSRDDNKSSSFVTTTAPSTTSDLSNPVAAPPSVLLPASTDTPENSSTLAPPASTPFSETSEGYVKVHLPDVDDVSMAASDLSNLSLDSPIVVDKSPNDVSPPPNDSCATHSCPSVPRRRRPRPIALGFSSGHFSALVGTLPWDKLGVPVPAPHHMSEPKPSLDEVKSPPVSPSKMRASSQEPGDSADSTKAGETAADSTQQPPVFYPIVDHKLKRLVVHFLKEDENEDELLNTWLDLTELQCDSKSVLGVRVDEEDVKSEFIVSLLSEYFREANENLKQLSEDQLDEIFKRKKKCADCKTLAVLKETRCKDCNIRFNFGPYMEVSGASIGQGHTRGLYQYKGMKNDYPFYEKAVRGGTNYYLWVCPHLSEGLRWHISDQTLHDACNSYLDYKGGPPSKMPNESPGQWLSFTGQQFVASKITINRSYGEAPKAKPPVVTGPCQRLGCELHGTDVCQGYCTACYGYYVYGQMRTENVPEAQHFVAGDYKFLRMAADDIGELRPVFKRSHPEFFLYYLNGEWSFGAKVLGAERNIIVPSSDLPHQVTENWSYWDRGWCESKTFRVIQTLPLNAPITLTPRSVHENVKRSENEAPQAIGNNNRNEQNHLDQQLHSEQSQEEHRSTPAHVEIQQHQEQQQDEQLRHQLQHEQVSQQQKSFQGQQQELQQSQPQVPQKSLSQQEQDSLLQNQHQQQQHLDENQLPYQPGDPTALPNDPEPCVMNCGKPGSKLFGGYCESCSDLAASQFQDMV